MKLYKPVFGAVMVAMFAGLLANVGCNVPMATPSAEPATAVSVEKFDELVHSDKLVLVKFGATWCGPCRQVDQELEALESQLPADVQVLKIDVDENPELAQEFQISSIPRLMLVRSGEVLADEVGYMSRSQLQSWIGEHRGGSAEANTYTE